jgi:hypothetical protein
MALAKACLALSSNLKASRGVGKRRNARCRRQAFVKQWPDEDLDFRERMAGLKHVLKGAYIA